MAECNHSRRKEDGSCQSCHHKKWTDENREHVRSYDRAYYQKNKAKFVEAHRRHRAKDPVRYLASVRQYRQSLRFRAIERLGGVCEVCGIDDEMVLEFDHRVPIGRKGKSGAEVSAQIYAEVIRSVDPRQKFSLLCANCHRRKTRINGEHRRRRET